MLASSWNTGCSQQPRGSRGADFSLFRAQPSVRFQVLLEQTAVSRGLSRAEGNWLRSPWRHFEVLLLISQALSTEAMGLAGPAWTLSCQGRWDSGFSFARGSLIRARGAAPLLSGALCGCLQPSRSQLSQAHLTGLSQPWGGV